MDKMRERHIAEMNRLREAMKETKSKYLANDYGKAYRKMQRELAEYDRFKRNDES